MATATSTLHTAAGALVIVVGVTATACTAPDESYGEVESYATVSSYLTSTCSTASVIGLSRQIADEVGCANPTGLVTFAAGGNLTITSNAVLPYLAQNAKTDLVAVAQNTSVQVNSAFRTIAQQYLLYQWYLQGRCGITAAATVGNSNHESGRAVDLAGYSSVITAMANRGWAHDVPGDDVHFDHLASADIRGQDVRAFQKLWNRNHAADQIAEDGDYGPATESRLRQSPAEGFAAGASCVGTRDLEVVAINGPDRAPPQQRVHYSISIKNSGTVSWPATTKLRLATGTSSQLYDSSWVSQTVIATLGSPIAAGKTGAIDFDVTTPATDVELPVSQALVLDDAGTKFGDIPLAVTVVPGMTGDESGDGSEGGAEGGCQVGGGGGAGIALALLGLIVRRRARRAA